MEGAEANVGDSEISLSLDEIIKIRNIQAPPSTSSAAQNLFGTSVRGRGFINSTRPAYDLVTNSSNKMLASAYHAGVAAGLRQRFMEQRGFNRGGFNRGGYNRGGMHRGGIRRIGFMSPGITGARQNVFRQLPKQIPIPGIIKQEPHLQDDLQSIQIQVPGNTQVEMPPMRDRLGWYPWQRLTPAQQVARNKLHLAKMRLRQRGKLPESRAFNVGLWHGKQRKVQAVQPSQWWTHNENLPAGVSPLLRQNVACLPGGVANMRGLSVKSFTTNSTRKKICRLNNKSNRSYLSERQFGENAAMSMSAAALQERMLPSCRWGSHNRRQKHDPRLDLRIQETISLLQQNTMPRQHELVEDFEYSAPVSATQTTSSDRFSLIMGLKCRTNNLEFS